MPLKMTLGASAKNSLPKEIKSRFPLEYSWSYSQVLIDTAQSIGRIQDRIEKSRCVWTTLGLMDSKYPRYVKGYFPIIYLPFFQQ